MYALRKEEISTSRQTVRWFYLSYLEDGTINQRPGSGRPLKLVEDSLAMVEQLIQQDDKTTATQIYSFLVHNGVDLLLTTIHFSRISLLSAYSRGKPTETFAMGSAAPSQQFSWCCLDWWDNCSAAITQAILLL